MKFTQITIIDDCGIEEPIVQKISELSKSPLVIFKDTPVSKEEIIQRIGDSDCVLLSWKTSISAEILQACPSLKFIGLCCSLYDEKSANVDIAAARKAGITVKGVRDYGDEGAAEFIFAQLIYLFQGLGKYQWKAAAAELKGKSIGIIGLGTLGGMVATMARPFGMKVFYYNRSRKPEAEQKGIAYLPLQKLLSTCDVVTTHLPKNTILLGETEFNHKKKNSILINTSLGLTFDKRAFCKWLSEDESSYAIFDADGMAPFEGEIAKMDRVISSDKFAGFTAEAKVRLSEKVLENLLAYQKNWK